MAPVRRLRSLAWMKARRFPGVRCSTLNTECRSLLCLMIMPGRSWVAGIAIAGNCLLKILLGGPAGHRLRLTRGPNCLFYTEMWEWRNGGTGEPADERRLSGRQLPWSLTPLVPAVGSKPRVDAPSL